MKLQRLSIHSVQDLLFLLPLRYEDRTRLADIGSLCHGQRVTIEGEIELGEIVYRGRRMLLCHLSDGTGSLLLRFFHFSKSQAKNNNGPGEEVLSSELSGSVTFITLYASAGYSNAVSNNQTITKLVLRGTGTNPFI